jgi:hypothetical protein
MTALSSVYPASVLAPWTDSRYTDAQNAALSADVPNFIAYGNSEVTVLANIALAQNTNDILARKADLAQWEIQFEQAYEQVYADFYTQNVASVAPTMAFPPGSYVPTPSPAPSTTPAPSPTAAQAASGSPAVPVSPAPSPAKS